MRSDKASREELALWRDGKFRVFVFGIAGAYAAVLIRCIYRYVFDPPFTLLCEMELTFGGRIAEMAGGWGNEIMQDEVSFLVLDSSLMVVTVYLLTIFHPGLFFPQMANGYSKRNNTAAAAAVSDAESSETKTESPDLVNNSQKTELSS